MESDVSRMREISIGKLFKYYENLFKFSLNWSIEKSRRIGSKSSKIIFQNFSEFFLGEKEDSHTTLKEIVVCLHKEDLGKAQEAKDWPKSQQTSRSCGIIWLAVVDELTSKRVLKKVIERVLGEEPRLSSGIFPMELTGMVGWCGVGLECWYVLFLEKLEDSSNFLSIIVVDRHIEDLGHLSLAVVDQPTRKNGLRKVNGRVVGEELWSIIGVVGSCSWVEGLVVGIHCWDVGRRSVVSPYLVEGWILVGNKDELAVARRHCWVEGGMVVGVHCWTGGGLVVGDRLRAEGWILVGNQGWVEGWSLAGINCWVERRKRVAINGWVDRRRAGYDRMVGTCFWVEGWIVVEGHHWAKGSIVVGGCCCVEGEIVVGVHCWVERWIAIGGNCWVVRWILVEVHCLSKGTIVFGRLFWVKGGTEVEGNCWVGGCIVVEGHCWAKGGMVVHCHCWVEEGMMVGVHCWVESWRGIDGSSPRSNQQDKFILFNDRTK